jgi:AcrR family transcriptional regulator
MLTTRKTSGRRRRKSIRGRDPQQTRTNLLRAAFKEVYHAGFQGTGLDRILTEAAVTKGALYHYFGSKEALGYAILDEVILEITENKWLRPLAESVNPIDTLIEIVNGTSPFARTCGRRLPAQQSVPRDVAT